MIKTSNTQTILISNMNRSVLLTIFLLLTGLPGKSFALPKEITNIMPGRKNERARAQEYYYGYIDRDHSLAESSKHIAAIYGVSWVLYPLTQPKTFKNNGSWDNYKKNFGDVVFDRDEPFWNWFIHPISGSQLFLYYRANGYSRINSFAMSLISSTLFEFTVEVYTEPASVQDLYQTPVLGSVLGVTLENLSMYLLNTGNAFGRFLGHLINPMTLFWFYEGKVRIVPQINLKGDGGGFSMVMDF